MPKRVLLPFRHPKKLKPYLDALLAVGIEPVAADVAERVRLGDVAGLLLMGGTDVNPARYKATPWPQTDSPDDVRDQAEFDLLDDAMAKDLPVFAICRGLQILNAHHGGTLVQHLSSTRHDPDAENKSLPAHEISIEQSSLLGEIAGVRSWRVNSRHHQAADQVGRGLRVVARDPEDGTIEALAQSDKRFVLAVQWHPEDQIAEYPEQLKLFRRFAEAL
jgi:putative glutamine amidotransferase